MDIDCNYCKNIILTEWEQRSLKNKAPHICALYNKILHHNSQDKNAIKIYPCKECDDERNINYYEY